MLHSSCRCCWQSRDGKIGSAQASTQDGAGMTCLILSWHAQAKAYSHLHFAVHLSAFEAGAPLIIAAAPHHMLDALQQFNSPFQKFLQEWPLLDRSENAAAACIPCSKHVCCRPAVGGMLNIPL